MMGSPRRVRSEPEFLIIGREGVAPVARWGELAVTCWCERAILSIPSEVVLAGKTGSCGYEACHAPVPPIIKVNA